MRLDYSRCFVTHYAVPSQAIEIAHLINKLPNSCDKALRVRVVSGETVGRVDKTGPMLKMDLLHHTGKCLHRAGHPSQQSGRARLLAPVLARRSIQPHQPSVSRLPPPPASARSLLASAQLDYHNHFIVEVSLHRQMDQAGSFLICLSLDSARAIRDCLQASNDDWLRRYGIDHGERRKIEVRRRQLFGMPHMDLNSDMASALVSTAMLDRRRGRACCDQVGGTGSAQQPAGPLCTEPVQLLRIEGVAIRGADPPPARRRPRVLGDRASRRSSPADQASRNKSDDRLPGAPTAHQLPRGHAQIQRTHCRSTSLRCSRLPTLQRPLRAR